MKLKEYVTKIESAISLARRIGASQSQMSHWTTGFKPVPITRCIDIEIATSGLVTRRDLCPQWRKIWPELVQTRPRPAVV